MAVVLVWTCKRWTN